MSTELMIHDLHREVQSLKAELAINGGPAWRDVDDLAGKVKRLEKSVGDALTALKSDQTSAIRSAINAEHESTMSSLRAALRGTAELLKEREEMMRKEFTEQMASTASAASASARNAEAVARDQLEASVDVIRSMSYRFAHGE
jgi:vacuolar-type H+-ATPase subunit H